MQRLTEKKRLWQLEVGDIWPQYEPSLQQDIKVKPLHSHSANEMSLSHFPEEIKNRSGVSGLEFVGDWNLLAICNSISFLFFGIQLVQPFKDPIRQTWNTEENNINHCSKPGLSFHLASTALLWYDTETYRQHWFYANGPALQSTITFIPTGTIATI